MKTVLNKIKYIVWVSALLFLPSLASASSVYIDTKHSDFFVGDTVILSVRIDSENQNINVVEGSVLLDYVAGAISLIDINTSGSDFSLWPGKPSPSENNTSISFAGGSPGGLNSKNAIVLNIVLKLQQEGLITLTPANFSVYLNDGKGTKDQVNIRDLTINVSPKPADLESVDSWQNLILGDKTPPEPFQIYFGQDGSVFDGRKFLSFTTTDKQSGMAYYEVIEGDLPPIRSNDTYVLKEQNKSVMVTVIAYDAAGNTRESVYQTPSAPNYVVYIISFAIILFIILLVFIFRKIRKNKNINETIKE